MSIPLPAYAALTVLSLMLTSTAFAQRREPPAPPAEALEACEGRRAGASCSVETPHGTMEGTCGAPEGQPLACRPARGPGGGGPPPESMSACEGHAAERAMCVLPRRA